MEQAVENPRQAGQYQDRVQETLDWYKGFPQIGEQLRELSTKVDEQTFYHASEFVANYKEQSALYLAKRLNTLAERRPELVGRASEGLAEQEDENRAKSVVDCLNYAIDRGVKTSEVYDALIKLSGSYSFTAEGGPSSMRGSVDSILRLEGISEEAAQLAAQRVRDEVDPGNYAIVHYNSYLASLAQIGETNPQTLSRLLQTTRGFKLHDMYKPNASDVTNRLAEVAQKSPQSLEDCLGFVERNIKPEESVYFMYKLEDHMAKFISMYPNSAKQFIEAIESYPDAIKGRVANNLVKVTSDRYIGNRKFQEDGVREGVLGHLKDPQFVEFATRYFEIGAREGKYGENEKLYAAVVDLATLKDPSQALDVLADEKVASFLNGAEQVGFTRRGHSRADYNVSIEFEDVVARLVASAKSQEGRERVSRIATQYANPSVKDKSFIFSTFFLPQETQDSLFRLLENSNGINDDTIGAVPRDLSLEEISRLENEQGSLDRKASAINRYRTLKKFGFSPEVPSLDEGWKSGLETMLKTDSNRVFGIGGTNNYHSLLDFFRTFGHEYIGAELVEKWKEVVGRDVEREYGVTGKNDFRYVPLLDLEQDSEGKELIREVLEKEGDGFTANFPLSKVYETFRTTDSKEKDDPYDAARALLTGMISQPWRKGRDGQYHLNSQGLRLALQHFDKKKLRAARLYTQSQRGKLYKEFKGDLESLLNREEGSVETALKKVREKIITGGRREKVEPISDMVAEVEGIGRASDETYEIRFRMQDRTFDDLFDNETTHCCAFLPNGVNREASVGYLTDPDIGLLHAKAVTRDGREVETSGVAILVNTKTTRGDKVLLVDSVEGGDTLHRVKDQEGLMQKFYDSVVQVARDNNQDKVLFNVNATNGFPERFNGFLERKKLECKRIHVTKLSNNGEEERYLESFGDWTRNCIGKVDGWGVDLNQGDKK
jgi:hypothetical protein